MPPFLRRPVQTWLRVFRGRPMSMVSMLMGTSDTSALFQVSFTNRSILLLRVRFLDDPSTDGMDIVYRVRVVSR